MLESRIILLKEELNPLKREETTGCDINIVGRRVADNKGDVSILVDRLRRDTFNSYASIRRNVEHLLLAVDSRLKNLTDLEAQNLQWGVHAALCSAVVGVQESFVEAPEVLEQSQLDYWVRKT